MALGPSLARSQPLADDWLARLDEAYYYPQHQGLEKLAVRIEWSQRDPAGKANRPLPLPELRFTWDKNQGAVFTLAPNASPDGYEHNELLDTARMYKEILIPLTLKEKLSRYRGKQLPSSKHRLHLEFESTDPNPAIRKYQMIADREKRRIEKFRLHRQEAPKAITSTLSYTKKEGKWLVEESRSRFQIEGEDYTDVTELDYQNIEGLWLPRKAVHTIKRDGSTLQSYTFRFKDYRLTQKEP